MLNNLGTSLFYDYFNYGSYYSTTSLKKFKNLLLGGDFF